MGRLGQAIPGDTRPLRPAEEGALPPRGAEDELEGAEQSEEGPFRGEKKERKKGQRLVALCKTLEMLTETSLPSA